MYIGVDLGSTNIKAAIYDGNMRLVDRQSKPVQYIRDSGYVEFDAVAYYNDLLALIKEMVACNGVKEIKEIAFTGQAESLICLDKEGKPLMNAISWMDERSTEECKVLGDRFPGDVVERTTGQQAMVTAMPATKILWLKQHRPEVYNNTATYILLKDYIVYRLTGKLAADMSIATFTAYFDIYEKKYWKEMLEAIGISEAQVPAPVEPCTTLGTLTAEAAAAMHLTESTRVNVGTLDHFAGMIGTGNVTLGGVTLSTGTVMALTTMSSEPAPRDSGIAMHYGFLPDTHVMLPVAESGGVSLEWFRRTCMGTISYTKMNEELAKRELPNSLLFLPYLVGTNAPEFDTDATGVFFGLRQENDVYDMAGAIMEGVSFVLRKNCDDILKKGTKVQYIIATGGGAKSAIWCQMQADITRLPVVIPAEKEAACLGAALVAAVADGRYASYEAAAKECVSMVKRYEPRNIPAYEEKYKKFCALYDAVIKVTRM